MYKTLECTLRERVGYITLNHSARGNSLDLLTIQELTHAVLNAEHTPGVKVIVINAKGADFSVGADTALLTEMQAYTLEQNYLYSTALAELFKVIYRSTKVSIAQVEGNASAAGAGLAMVCDFVFTTPQISMKFDEVKNGSAPAIALYFLLRKLGESRCKSLLLTGMKLNASKMFELGLIQSISAESEIQETVFKFAQTICQENAESSLQLIKKMMADIPAFMPEQAMEFAAKMNAYALNSEDNKRGVEAILNKEQIVW